MKQILIASNDTINDMAGKKFTFRIDDTILPDLLIKSGKVNTLKIPFRLEVLQGEGEFDLKFVLPQSLALSGVNLLGAYLTKTHVIAAFNAVEGADIEFEKGTAILEATLVQVVTYKAIKEGKVGAATVVVFGNDKNVKVEKVKEKKTKKST